jgi:hypothetical protein
MGDEVMAAQVVMSWQPDEGTLVYIPARRVIETFKDRIQMRRRVWRQGAKLDSTLGDPVAWEAECLFHNGHEEGPEVPDPAYPDYVRKVCAQLRKGMTGTLTLPDDGPKRAKVETYRKTTDAEARDAALLVISWLEDSEDDFNATSFEAPSAKATAAATAAAAVDSWEEAGAWSDDIASFQELAAGLEAIANAPGEYADAYEAQANAIMHAAQRVEDAFTSSAATATSEVGKLLTDPANSRAGLLNRRVSDAAMRSTRAVTGGGATVITVTFARELSIFDVAAERQQDPAKLASMNASLGDLLRIAAKTPIRVFK